MSIRLRPVYALLALTLLVPSAAPASQPWPGFRGPRASGASLEALPAGDGQLTLATRWKRPLGSGYAGLALAEGLLVTAFTAGERDVVAAFDPETGAERWRYDLAPVYPGHDGSHDGPIATPAIADGRVFALGAWGHVAALDLASGTPLWTLHLQDDLGCAKPYYGFGSSPAVAGDRVVLQVGGEEGSVIGLDAATGELVWRAVADQAFSQSPIVTELEGRRQVVVLGNERMAGLDPADGAVLWSLEHGAEIGPMGALTASPLPVGGNRLFLKLEDGSASLVSVHREGAEAELSVLRKTRGLVRSYSPPTLWDGRAYGYTARFLSALDLDSGQLLWRSREPGDGFLIAVDGWLAVLTKEGTVHLGEASPEGWSESARLELFADPAWTPPSYAAGALYLRSLGEMARVDLRRAGGADRMASGPELPPLLRPLAERIAAGAGAEAVDELLADRDLPLIDGESALFLWRGEADDVAIAGDMIGMRSEEPMHRLEGTDLWWWQAEIGRRARINYLFFVDFQPTVDPSHQRRFESTILGPDMNWRRQETVEMSWFAMPDWPGWQEDAELAAGSGGRLETVELELRPPARPGREETPEPVTATVHVWLPPGYDRGEERYPVVFVHNRFARDIGRWPEILDREVGRSLPPLIAVLVEPPRVRGYSRLFAEQIAAPIDQRYRTRTDRDSRAMVGMGFQGLNAALTAFENGDRFGALGVQSFFGLDEQLSNLEAALDGKTAQSDPMRVYLEWGRWDLTSRHEEMNMRQASRKVWERLREGGWQPMGGEVWDSTDWPGWSRRTALMLQALFNPEGIEPALDAWSTGGP